MAAPPLAPVPPAAVRLSLAPAEWEAGLDAWLALAHALLRRPSPRDNDPVSSPRDNGPAPPPDHGLGSVPHFLRSYYHELGRVQRGDATLATPKARLLRKTCFKLVSRIAAAPTAGKPVLLECDFLADLCRAHIRSASLPPLMARLWLHSAADMAHALHARTDAVAKLLQSRDLGPAIPLLARLAPVIHASPDMGAVFLARSGFLHSLVAAYARATTDQHAKAISTVVYLGLVSLVRIEPPNLSLLAHHLCTLTRPGGNPPPNRSVLSDIVTNTSLLPKLRRSVGNGAPDRLTKLLDTLDTYRSPSLARRGRRGAKGKQPASTSDLHVHQMSLVTHVQDLFPHLGSGFVLKLLGEYSDDVEQVTAHLLEDSLPPHLASCDRSEQAPIDHNSARTGIDALVPESTTPSAPQVFVPEMRNAFDGDELDRRDLDPSRLHIGKRNKSTVGPNEPNKAAIWAALAAFDSDDDERDDTYDGDDVGGTVDSAHPDGEPGHAAEVAMEENDAALLDAYKSAPEMFGRAFDVRRSQARLALKSETGMSDEQIEGWAVMLQRDPKRLRRLEAQARDRFAGQQPKLERTSYRQSPGGTETEDSDAAQGGRGGFRGRGRGRGRGDGGGASVAGPSRDPNTAHAQRTKGANKSSRANHNRREGRARKMARGGYSG